MVNWTPERHAAAKERCERATPGPLLMKRAGVANEIWANRGMVAELSLYPHGSQVADANGEFFAHARTDLPDALAEIERLRAALEQVRSIAALKLAEDPNAEGIYDNDTEALLEIRKQSEAALAGAAPAPSVWDRLAMKFGENPSLTQVAFVEDGQWRVRLVDLKNDIVSQGPTLEAAIAAALDAAEGVRGE